MPSNYTLGKDGKLYLLAYDGRLFTADGASPDYSTPTEIMSGAVENTDFAIYGNCQDVTLTTDTDEQTITAREDGGFEATIATVKRSTIEFGARWKKGDTFFGWIKDAWLNSAEIAVMAMDGPWDTSGNSGLIGNFSVTGFSREEPVAGIMTASITLKGSSYLDFYEHA
jgi:hypothetical protein